MNALTLTLRSDTKRHVSEGDDAKRRTIGRRRYPPPLWGRIKEGGRTGPRKLCFDPSSETAARPPTPARPHIGRPEGRPSLDGLWGAGARRTFTRLTSPDCPDAKRPMS